MLALIIAQAIAGTAPAAAPAPTPASAPMPDGVTPSPDFPAFRAIAEYYIRDHAADPDSLKFRWNQNIFGLGDKRFLGVDFACGRLNQRNHLGGLTGYQWFYIGEKGGTVFMFDIDNSTDGGADPSLGPDEAACHRWNHDQVAPLPPPPATNATP